MLCARMEYRILTCQALLMVLIRRRMPHNGCMATLTPENRDLAPGRLGALQAFLNSEQLGGVPGINEGIAAEVRRRHGEGASQAAIAAATGLERTLVAALARGVPVVDALSTAKRAAGWFSEHAAPDFPALEVDELLRLRVFRRALRELALRNAGAEYDTSAQGTLDDLASAESVRLRFAGCDGPRLETATATGWLLAVAFDAMRDGSWARMKRCVGDGCPHVFYDASKNRSGTWCAMAVCGNRRKVRAYQVRKRASRVR